MNEISNRRGIKMKLHPSFRNNGMRKHIWGVNLVVFKTTDIFEYQTLNKPATQRQC